MNDIEKAWQRVCMWIGCTPEETDTHEDFLTIKKALEKQLNDDWIPFRTEYDEDYDMDMFQGKLPDDEQEILVSNGKSVWSDTFMIDGMECYLDSGNDLIITAKAWQPLPEPYMEEETKRIKKNSCMVCGELIENYEIVCPACKMMAYK